MKKFYLVFLLAALSGWNFAQTVTLQTGVSLSSVTLDSEGSMNNITHDIAEGYALFLGVDYLEHEYYNLSTSIGFIEIGWSGGDSPTSSGYVFQVDYFSINTMIDLKYPVSENISPFVTVGPRVNFVTQPSSNFYINRNKNDLVWGMNLGAGLKYDLPAFIFEISSVYNFSFQELVSFDENYLGKGEYTDNTFTVNILFGYKF